ncbi:MAG: aromatic amino acid ammonia-lyase [Myxococcota bacterium]
MATSSRSTSHERLVLGESPVRIEDVLAVARGEVCVELDDSPASRTRLAAGPAALDAALRRDQPVYGITTGVGSSVVREVPPEERKLLALNLLRFHGCGTGRALDAQAALAVLVVRLVSLARGFSGVRREVLERLCELVNLGLAPRIPEEGSVGASGDLTPLSYVGALLVGEREVLWNGAELPAPDALARAGLEPLALEPRESLALMNGTSVMTALACLSIDRAERLARLASAVTALVVQALAGNPGHFEARIFELKPHLGTQRAARWIREDLGSTDRSKPSRLQDPYSIRCAPHVIGILLDALAFGRSIVEIELNGVNDNPIVDPDDGSIYHGGNFYGGHIAFVMDGLKTAVAGVADLIDRQLQLLCNPDTNAGLPRDLIRGDTQHGFKAMQISTSALAAEALKLTMPAASFSRSTESHNQDKVSMGTIAARDCGRVLELTETVAAIAVLAGCQAFDLRGGSPSGRSPALHQAVRSQVPPVETDRRQDRDIERVLELYRSGALLAWAPVD